MKTYSIKRGYRHNADIDTPTHGAGYWTPGRVRASRYYQYSVYALAARVLAARNCRTVLDVGCGPGTKLAVLADRFPNVRFTGVDLAEAIEYCRATHPQCTWEVADFNQSGSAGPDTKADLVVCSDVIEHVHDPDVLLQFVRQKLTADARVILSTPERDLLCGPDATSPGNEYHVREWNRPELEAYVRSSGFEIEQYELQHPVRLWPNAIFFQEVLRRAITGQPLKYNQVLLLRAVPA